METKKTSFAFPSRQFLTEMSYQLSNDIEILSMTPDTLFFRFDQMSQKLVKVKPLVNVNLKKQFQISGKITTEPSTVVVNGPQSTLDTLQFVYTKAKEFNEIDQSIQVRAEINPTKELFFDPQSVELIVPVEEYTEAQQAVPVMLTNIPANVKVKLFPARVKVSFLVGLSRFSDIHPEDFKLAVSYSDIEGGQQRLRIQIVSTPAFLYDVKITPDEIEYLIEN
jgi:YbbR domain-containing protein